MDILKDKRYFRKLATIMLVILSFIEVVYVLISTIQSGYILVLFMTAPIFLINVLWIYFVATDNRDKKLSIVFIINIAIALLIILLTTLAVIIEFFTSFYIDPKSISILLQLCFYIMIDAIMIYIILSALGSKRDKFLKYYKLSVIVLTVFLASATFLSFTVAISDSSSLDFVYTLLYSPFEILAYIYTILWVIHGSKEEIEGEVEKDMENGKIQLDLKQNISHTSENNTSNKQTDLSIHEKIEVLKGYKELLDTGIISQEEFDAKKKEIL